VPTKTNSSSPVLGCNVLLSNENKRLVQNGVGIRQLEPISVLSVSIECGGGKIEGP
jgi:hypothetical protein